MNKINYLLSSNNPKAKVEEEELLFEEISHEENENDFNIDSIFQYITYSDPDANKEDWDIINKNEKWFVECKICDKKLTFDGPYRITVHINSKGHKENVERITNAKANPRIVTEKGIRTYIKKYDPESKEDDYLVYKRDNGIWIVECLKCKKYLKWHGQKIFKKHCNTNLHRNQTEDDEDDQKPLKKRERNEEKQETVPIVKVKVPKKQPEPEPESLMETLIKQAIQEKIQESIANMDRTKLAEMIKKTINENLKF